MIYLKNSRILFLKRFKVAGTSFEIALSRYAAPNDIVTKLHSDETLRAERGFQGPTNYRWSAREILSMRRNEALRCLYYASKRQKFHQHTSAKEARAKLGAERFDAAFRISIVRNPFDYAISHWHWQRKTSRTVANNFESWLRQNPWVFTQNDQFYFIDGGDIIDFYIRYEFFDSDISRLEDEKSELKGLAETFSGIKAKSGIRPKDATVEEYFVGKEELIETVLFFQGHHISRFNYPVPGR